MYNEQDYNLEKKCRDAAQHFSDPSLIPDWNQLEKKLDIELPVSKKRRRFLVLYILFSVLFSMLLFKLIYNSQNDNNTQSITGAKTTKKNLAEKSLSLNSKADKGYSDTVDVNQINNLTANKVDEKKKVNLNNLVVQALNTTLPNSKYVIIESKQPQNKLMTISSDKEDMTVRIEKENSTTDIFTLDSNQNLKLKKDILSNLIEKTLDSNTEITDNKQNGSVLNKDSVNNSIINPKKNKKDPGLNRKFNVAAVIGTNINSVHLNKFSQAGSDYGFIAGYRISPKIEIKTGVIFSRKYFNASGKSMTYDSAKLSLPSYTSITLQDATGYCRFVEVPIMFYYHFLSNKKTSFYTGAGFSVNMMKMKKIHYTFLLNGNDVVKRSNPNAVHDVNRHLASYTSNFSIGINRKIVRNWSIALEPYIKIPITKTDNDLTFTTLGTSASFIYNLNPKKNK